MPEHPLPDRYTDVLLIARGGMGEVYRAVDSVLHRKVAVKVLSERHAREDEVRARFRREALAAARLSGTAHVITVFDVGEHHERPFIVMEYLEGGSVHDRLRANGRMLPGQALEWLGQAAVALDRAHADGVVHRDVKPANLLLDRDGNIVVTDFGIASTSGVDTLTLPGTVLGTAGYLSPEQARGEPATAASDRYGLGVVAFELLTGRRPYEADTAAAEAFAHVTAPVPSAEKIHPELPDGVDEVLERALAKDPEDRPPTASILVSELRDAFRGAAPPTRVAALSPVPAPDPARRRQMHTPVASQPRSRGLALGAAGFLVAGLVLAALLGAILDPDGPERQAAERRPSVSTTRTQTTGEVEGRTLGDAGFALMQNGDYERARPLLLAAVKALRGSGIKEEAWALYNLSYTRYQLGECAGISTLLGRSERIQGRHADIDALRRATYDRCVGGDDVQKEDEEKKREKDD